MNGASLEQPHHSPVTRERRGARMHAGTLVVMSAQREQEQLPRLKNNLIGTYRYICININIVRNLHTGDTDT